MLRNEGFFGKQEQIWSDKLWSYEKNFKHTMDDIQTTYRKMTYRAMLPLLINLGGARHVVYSIHFKYRYVWIHSKYKYKSPLPIINFWFCSPMIVKRNVCKEGLLKKKKEFSLTFNPSQASSWSINRNYFPIKSEPRVSAFFFCLHLHNLPPWSDSSVKVPRMLFVLIGPDVSTSLE